MRWNAKKADLTGSRSRCSGVVAIQDEGVEPKGFAPIGIAECWNNGILGLKRCFILISLFHIIPIFHYPLIEMGIGQINTYKFPPQGDRNSEIHIYFVISPLSIAKAVNAEAV